MNALFTAALLALNGAVVLCALVGAVWLAVSGAWAALGLGAFMLLAGPLIGPRLLMPAAVVKPALARAGSFGVLPVLNFIWTQTVTAGWCLSVFYAAVTAAPPGALAPALIWGYAAATGPWTYLALMESSEDSATAVTILQAASAAFAAVFWFMEGAAFAAAAVFFAVAVPGWIYKAVTGRTVNFMECRPGAAPRGPVPPPP